MSPTGVLASLLAVLAIAPACAQMSPVPPGGSSGPCIWTGTAQVDCSGTLEAYDVQELLSDILSAVSESGSVTVRLSEANVTGQQVSFIQAAAYDAFVSPQITLILEGNTVISKNQFVVFGALAAQSGMQLDLQVTDSQVLDNQFVVAAGIVTGGAGTARLNAVNSEVRGNMLSTAGALAVSGAAEATATGTGGNASTNLASAAGFVATGGAASASADLSVPGDDSNKFLGTGLAFTEEALVSSIISTVMNAVFVDSDTLPTGLANIQSQLCSAMTNQGSLQVLAEDLGIQPILAVAWSILCDPSSDSTVKISDIPSMLDGSASPGAMAIIEGMRKLVTGNGHMRVRSVPRALAFLALHPKIAAQLAGFVEVAP